MRFIKNLRSLFIIISIAPLLVGCDRSIEPLRIAAHKWPGYEFMFLAQREGWLDKDDIYIEETPSASASLRALIEGKVDGVALTLDEVLRARADGIPLQVVLVFDESAGADALITKKKMTTLAELKGLRIGVEKTTVGALMLHKVLAAAKLSENSVTLVNSTIDNHLQDWQRDKFDALITYEPLASQLEEQGGRRMFDSRDIADLIFDVLAVRPEVARKHTYALRDLARAHFRALQHMRSSPHDTAYRMAHHLGLEGDKVLGVFRGLELPNVASNRRYLSDGDKVSLAARELSAIMVKMKAIPKPDTLTELVTKIGRAHV